MQHLRAYLLIALTVCNSKDVRIAVCVYVFLRVCECRCMSEGVSKCSCRKPFKYYVTNLFIIYDPFHPLNYTPSHFVTSATPNTSNSFA